MSEVALVVVDVFPRINACRIAADSSALCAFAMELF
jgi:hypothetical protein